MAQTAVARVVVAMGARVAAVALWEAMEVQMVVAVRVVVRVAAARVAVEMAAAAKATRSR